MVIGAYMRSGTSISTRRPHGLAPSSREYLLDIYRAYCGIRPEAPAILQTIRAAYEAADIFLQTQPHMPMSDLPNRRSIGPIGRVGSNRREDICKTLDISHGKRIVLATVGGIPSDKPLFLPRSGTLGIRKDISELR